MATSDELFPGARVSTHRIAPAVRGMHIEPRLGTVIGPEGTRSDDNGDYKIACKCGCGGYWIVRWDMLEAPNDTMSFLAHDLTVLEVVDQLAYRAEWSMGDIVRTSFDGKVFPGVWKIIGIKDAGAQLESEQEKRTWSPLEDLVAAPDAQFGQLSLKQKAKVAAFAQFIDGLDHKRTEAALDLLKSAICVYCGTSLTKERPRCYCMRDE